MYTINDIRGQFNIEGPIRVMKYHNNYPVNEEYELCYQQENGTSYNIPDEFCNINITYMYAEDGYLIIEIETDDEE